MEEGHSPSVQYQYRMNLILKDVVRKEVIYWLNASIVYPILDVNWVSLFHAF